MSIDDEMKALQLAKLTAEVKNLSRWSFDTFAKALVSVLAVALGAWTLYLGVPKAQLDLLKVSEDRLKAEDQRRLSEKAVANLKLEIG